MVDAVNAVNAATNIKIRLSHDLTRDWHKMTASQVLECAQHGEDVPVEILKWAEDYSKVVNNPDGVTYDASGGESRIESTDEKSTTTSEEASGMTENEKERYALEHSNNNYAAGITAANQAAGAEDATTTDENAAVSMEDKGEAISASIQNNETQKVNELRTKQAQYNTLVKQLSSNSSGVTPADLNKLQMLEMQLGVTGRNAQKEIAGFEGQLQEIVDELGQYSANAQKTVDVGTQALNNVTELQANKPETSAVKDTAKLQVTADTTVEVSNDATVAKLSQAEQRLNSSKYLFVERFTNTAASAIDKGTTAAENFDAAKEDSSTAKKEINPAIKKLEDSSKVAVNADTSANTDNDTDNAKKSSPVKKADAKSDADIQADDLELRKRKEQRGELEPPA